MKPLKPLSCLTAFAFVCLAHASLYAQLSDDKALNILMDSRNTAPASSVLNRVLSETSYPKEYGMEWDARLNITKGSATLRQTSKRTDIMTKHGEGTEIPIEKGDVIQVYPDSEAEIRLY